jgi:hypothetical protein
VSVRTDAQVNVLCTRTSLDSLERFDPEREYDSGEPTVTVNQYGKGQAIYVAGDVGGAYLNNPYPPLKRFVAHLVKRSRTPIEIEAPEAIEATAAVRDSGELMIHLVNNPTPIRPWRIVDTEDGNRQREYDSSFFALHEVNPIHDVRLQFNDFEVKSARLPLHEENLEVAGNSIVVSEVELHEVILVDLER